METPSLLLKMQLEKLRKEELERVQNRILLNRNKQAAREVLLSISLVLDRNMPSLVSKYSPNTSGKR
jgi:hypothetical protein